MLADFVIRVSLIVIPLYLSNSFALILGRGQAIDFGKRFFDGREIFGNGKTFKGAVGGLLAGLIAAAAIAYAFPDSSTYFNVNYLYYGALLSAGAIIGDVVASFFKRRLGLHQGHPWFPFDQLDFVVGGIVVGAMLYIPDLLTLIFVMTFTILAHRIANWIAYKTKVKGVPW